MSRRKRLFCVLLWAAALGWMAMIFWFSAKDGTASGDMSGGLIRFFAVRVSPGFSQLDAAEQAAVVESWQFAVRKLAHFSEYAVLGGLYAAAIRLSLNGAADAVRPLCGRDCRCCSGSLTRRAMSGIRPLFPAADRQYGMC